ncbi:MAG TPA: GNAT family N-acetyltransferase [Fimbriimonadaceae bacterium]|nr:GNAT family N-acetyltransferase [Fimbriimonadaceae bacterium]
MFESERLIFRPWKVDYVEGAFRIFGDPEVARWLAGTPVESIEVMRERIELMAERYVDDYPVGKGAYAAFEKSSGEIIGGGIIKSINYSVGVEPQGEIEVGWHLASSWWGMGYGKEIGRACIRQAFETVGLERVVAVAFPDNVRSLKVMESAGMRRVGLTDQYFDKTLELYEIFREDWKNWQSNLDM